MGTTFGNCEKCGAENVQMATTTRALCYKCYRAEERARERPIPDRHNPGLRKEHKRIFKAFSQVMGGLTDLGVTRDDVLDVRNILQPYLKLIQEYLDVVSPKDEPEPPEPTPGPGEQTPEASSLFTSYTFDRPEKDPDDPDKKPKKIHTMPK
jgi:hypothetical protein